MAHLEEFQGLKRIEISCPQQVFIFLLTSFCGLSGLNVERDCELQVSCKVIPMQYNLVFSVCGSYKCVYYQIAFYFSYTFIITSFSINSSNLLRRWINSGRKIGSSCQQMVIKWYLAKTTTRSFSWWIFGNFLPVSVFSWWKVNCFQIELYHSVNIKLSSIVTSNTTSKTK